MYLFSVYKPTVETNQIPLSRVTDAAQRYITLHRCLFGTYEGEIMPRPSPEILNKVMSRWKFLKLDLEIVCNYLMQTI